MNKKPICFQSFLLLVVLILSSSTVLAQNLITNPDFTVDTSGWNFTTPGTFTRNGSLDADSSPMSGSGELANTSPLAFGSSFAGQCVSGITAGSNYDWGAMMRFDSANTQTASGRANVVVNFYDAALCGGSNVGGGTTADFSSTNTDVWSQMEVLGFTAPTGSVTAWVSLFTVKTEDTGIMTVNFDNVVFGPAGTLPVELSSFTVE